MITRQQAFVTSDQQTFAALDAAIGHELALLFPDSEFPEKVVQWILDNRDKIVDLLTTTKTSKPRARKINGASKKRTPKPAADNAANAAINRALQDGEQ